MDSISAVRAACDHETFVLQADLSRTTNEAERTRLLQAIKAIERIRAEAISDADRLHALVTESQKNNHKSDLKFD